MFDVGEKEIRLGVTWRLFTTLICYSMWKASAICLIEKCWHVFQVVIFCTYIRKSCSILSKVGLELGQTLKCEISLLVPSICSIKAILIKKEIGSIKTPFLITCSGQWNSSSLPNIFLHDVTCEKYSVNCKAL